MEQEKAFDGLLAELTKSKWPSDFSGQKLFIQADDYYNNAMLGSPHFRWDLYAAGYKDAADALAIAVMNRQAPLDSVIYPLVFLYRQAIELQLKIILPVARRLNGNQAQADHAHGLQHMWYELRKLLKEISPEIKDKNESAMQAFILEINSIDPASFAFRYPEDKEGNFSLQDLRHINVRHLYEVMNSMFLWFSGVAGQLSEWDQNLDSY